ncbi:hypothetical protein [Geodermatophilus obscurus]|uniref:hypothetical protein n=1 Tax=Geodermatophilus obscurus TaxID=1861 RepID=UPI00019B7E8E
MPQQPPLGLLEPRLGLGGQPQPAAALDRVPAVVAQRVIDRALQAADLDQASSAWSGSSSRATAAASGRGVTPKRSRATAVATGCRRTTRRGAPVPSQPCVAATNRASSRGRSTGAVTYAASTSSTTVPIQRGARAKPRATATRRTIPRRDPGPASSAVAVPEAVREDRVPIVTGVPGGGGSLSLRESPCRAWSAPGGG